MNLELIDKRTLVKGFTGIGPTIARLLVLDGTWVIVNGHLVSLGEAAILTIRDGQRHDRGH